MQKTTPVQKALQMLVVMVFLAGSSAIVLHAYNNAYDDLPTFYWATQLAYNQGESAYQPGYFQQLGQILDRKIYPFLYPPPSLLLFSPFLFGDYDQSKAVFTLCNLVWWWLLTWLLYRLYCSYAGVDRHFMAGLLIPVWSLTFVPVLDTFRTGQINLFVLMCTIPLFFQSSRYWQQLLSGALLAIAIVLKVYLLLILPVLMAIGQKKVLAGALGALALLCAMSFLLLPWSLWPDWLALSHKGGAYGKQLPYVMTIPWNQSINGFFIRQFLDQGILRGDTYWPWLIYVCSGLVLATTLYVVSRALKQDIHSVSITVAMILLVILLIAPLTWQHHFVFAMPAIVCCFALLAKLEETSYKKTMTSGVVVLVLIMSFPSLPGVIFPNVAAMKSMDKALLPGANLVISAQLLAGLGFWGVFCALISHRGNRSLHARPD